MAKDNLIEGTYEELCKNQKMNEIILNSLTSQGKADGLYGFEQAKVIYLEPISLLEHGRKLIYKIIINKNFNNKQVA